MILHGDCLDILPTLDPESIDAVVTDPPYGLEFMGKAWDAPWKDERTDKRGVIDPKKWGGNQDSPNGGNAYSRSRIRTGASHYRGSPAEVGRAFQSWSEAWMREVYRAMKPGAHLLAFGGTRTHHRMMCAIEDAGFEIRDCLMWIFGSGFPKSHNLHGDHEGWGTALKPAYEPIIMARKPLIGTVAANVQEYGTGAINVDGCRVEHQSAADLHESTHKNQYTNYKNPGSNRDSYSGDYPPRVDYDGTKGRWPANVILDETSAAMLDEQSGDRQSGARPAKRGAGTKGYHGWPNGTNDGERIDMGSGGASRFFPVLPVDDPDTLRFAYVPKSSRSERNSGLDGMEERKVHPDEPNGRVWDIPGSHSTARANHHPTVKPIALMRWLVRLVTPPGGTVLDPFMGSGTTGIAAGMEGFEFIGIEREEEYIEIARRRIEHWEHPLMPTPKPRKPKSPTSLVQLTLTGDD